MMKSEGRLMDMLIGYASAHQHPMNVFLHMIGIPTIMLGVLIPLTWAEVQIGSLVLNLGHALVIGFFLFYLTLDVLFAVVFLVGAWLLLLFAQAIGQAPVQTSGVVAALAFTGGYAGQFIGHYIEKSMPVLVKQPIQANLAAPFFTVVELFKIAGLREGLFDEVQARIAERRQEEAAAS